MRTQTDELGATTTFTQGGPLNQPLSFSDARGSTIRYAYDAKGKVTATTYADNSVERATYDAQGNLDVLTNRRGQTNDIGWLGTATDASGTTTLSYSAADRLTRVEYPSGRWIQYAYDSAGRRSRLEDRTGFVEQYTYDNGGRLTREDKRNLTFTIYGYDGAGRVVDITHHAPGNSVNAEFTYTYDSAGRRITAGTSDGTWTYSYDLTDQLIRAVFASTNSSIPNQNLSYEYDALGNRVRTVLNGVTANYTANRLNQYTAAGATSFSYDLDGNLVQETGPDGIKSYTYDLINRLNRVQTPQGVVSQFEYDVLGNRTAVIVDGQRTEYVIDPTGVGSIVGEFGAGGLIAHFTQGLGLASRVATLKSNLAARLFCVRWISSTRLIRCFGEVAPNR